MIKDQQEKYKVVQKILWQILFLNILVAVAKLVFGYITNTSSMMADGFHSISDGTSNVIGIIGIWLASKPADEGHPYGHSKFETLSTIAISFMLFAIAYNVGRQAILQFGGNAVTPNISAINFIVMIITLIINISVARFEKRRGEELDSSILVSDAKHTQSDIYISISVIIGLIAVKLGYPIVDPIVSMIIAILIFKVGFGILKESIDVLIDTQALDSEKIYHIVMQIDGVKQCYDIRTRGKSDHVMMDMIINVDKSLLISEAHDIADKVEKVLVEKLDGVSEVIVHVGPERK